MENVAIKGNREGLLISLSPTEEWLLITQELAARLDEQSGFFNGARVTVDVGQRPVPKYELSSLKALLERRGLLLSGIKSESATTLASAAALDLRALDQRQDVVEDGTQPSRAAIAIQEASIDPEVEGTPGVLVKRTLRSGRTVHSRGHVVIYGDVNPGAKIIATGDVYVWGKLRGTVHAGAEGDTSAIVCALDMRPNQLRIAGLIVTSPREKTGPAVPEIAFVRDEQIIVEGWS